MMLFSCLWTELNRFLVEEEDSFFTCDHKEDELGAAFKGQ
jgi:hypothetical protein